MTELMEKGKLSKVTSSKYSYDAPMHENAELYDMASAIALSITNQALNFYKNNTKKAPTGLMLDVGCGQGAVTSYLRNRLPVDEIHAFDISEDVVEFARAKYGQDGLKFFTMDAAGLVPNEMVNLYDVVVCNTVLHWAKDHSKILTNMHTMLKPKGDCLLVFFHYHPLYTAYRDVSKTEKWGRYMQDVETFMPPYHDLKNAEVEFKKVMTSCGFKNVLVKSEAMDFGYRNGECDLPVFKSLFKAINPFILRLPCEDHDKFIDDITDQFIKIGGFKNFDGTTEYDGRPMEYNCSLIIAIGSK